MAGACSVTPVTNRYADLESALADYFFLERLSVRAYSIPNGGEGLSFLQLLELWQRLVRGDGDVDRDALGMRGGGSNRASELLPRLIQRRAEEPRCNPSRSDSPEPL